MIIKVELGKAESKTAIKFLEGITKQDFIQKGKFECRSKNKAFEFFTFINQNKSSVFELSIKPFFTEWILHSLIDQCKDLIQDIKTVSGETTVIVNGIIVESDTPMNNDEIVDTDYEDAFEEVAVCC